MPAPLRIGIVGIGFGQHVHLPAFRANRHCRVIAICASTQSRAIAVALSQRIPKAYGNWKDLVSDPQIDAISIAAPPELQHRIALAALKNGKPVFCEKPLAPTSHETLNLKRQAQARGIPAMINFEFPDIDVWKKTKRVLAANTLGRLRHVHVLWFVQARALQRPMRSWKTKTDKGGGVLNGFVSHSFYYLEYLLGPIQRLSAQLYDTVHRTKSLTTESLVSLNLEFARNLPASVVVSNHASQGSGHRIEIYGDKGSLKLINEGRDYTKGFWMELAKTGASTPIRVMSASKNDPKDGRIAITSQVVNRFVRWVREGIPGRPNLADGHRVQKLIERSRESYHRQKWLKP